MPNPVFGVVAEDETDFRVARVLIRRLLRRNDVSIKTRVTNGCGKLEQKLPIWIAQLADEGCDAIVVLRDLDRNPLNNALNDEIATRYRLENVAVPDGVRCLVCIPIEELEAWFWSDPAVVQHVGRGLGKASSSPHMISRPKEELIRLSRKADKKPRYSTNNNERLAELLSLDLCAQRCSSFRSLREFVLAER